MKILVVEDDELTAEFIAKTMRLENHDVVVANDGLEGFKLANTSGYGAIILDVLLPHKNGLEICKDLRRLRISTPILILSSESSEKARIDGLDAGADDYLVKPFNYKELQARIRAITRRPSVVIQSKLRAVDLTLDPASHEVHRTGTKLKLRPKEYDLLEYMMRNPNTALSRAQLLKDVWGIFADNSSNRLEVHIRHLREKVDKNHKHKLIQTVRGIGYRLIA